MANGGVRLRVTNNIPSFFDIFNRNKVRTLSEMGRFCKEKMDYYVPVDTGYLRSRNDYRITMDKNLELINNCHYALYQEFGTSKMAAQPFMRPAVYGHIHEIELIAGRNMGIDL